MKVRRLGDPGRGEMTVSFRINPALPRLAWLAKVDRDSLSVIATCGSRVECGRDFIVAGVWNGPFRVGDFATTDCFFGTGIIIRDDQVIFVTSAGMVDAIYYREHATSLIAANSLPLLLAVTGDQLDPHCTFYDQITRSLRAGIDGYRKSIPTSNGAANRVFVRNLKVTRSAIEEIDKRPPPPTGEFASYLRYLTENYARIYQNICDPDRNHRLDIVSTQSRGYDTTAVNAIATQHRIDTVFTIAEAKEVGGFVGIAPPSADNDDGSDICSVLGLTATSLDRRLYTRSFDDEHLFYASTHHAESANLLGMKPHLKRTSVMLTGLLGDVLWGTDPAEDGSHGPDTWLHGIAELSLEWGLIQVYPAAIGGRNHSDIHRLSLSEEMAPWRLGNDYDRPIPRRIGEQIGGIPTDLFGRRKMAAVTEFASPPVPVGGPLRREYFAYLRQHRVASRLWRLSYRLVHRINARIIFRSPSRYRYVYYGGRILSKLARREVNIPMLYRRLDGRLYCLCVNKRVREYQEAMRGDVFAPMNSTPGQP